VIPLPAEVHPDPGASFRLPAGAAIGVPGGDPGARRVGEYLAGLLRPATGYPLPVADTGAINLVLDGGPGGEAYRLDVAASGVTLRAGGPAGLFAGVQTLRQLLPAAIEARTPQRAAWVLPGGRIVDRPRFAYRGAMLDLARHFFGVADIKRYVDEIAQFKINHLHLHLTDDQGWRLEIRGRPQLTADGGGPGVGGEGRGYLTQAQYSEVVAYAAARFVTVVPEIDMPGHVNAAQVAYPDLTCDGRPVRPRTDELVGYSSLCAGSDETYTFVAEVLRQVAALTPGPYLHIGGDEAESTSDADYRRFLHRVLPMVARSGKRAVGWHDITAADPPPSAVAQYWRIEPRDERMARAAARGTKVIMSPADHTYLDMKYDKGFRLGLDWAGLLSVAKAYGWDPAGRLPGVGEDAVLGVEAPLWSETLRSFEDVETMAFPRLPAIAEIGWSPAAARDWGSFRRRLGEFGPRWDRQGVRYHRAAEIPWS
jgi:hexosaminidase